MITVVSIQNPFNPDTNIKDLFEYQENKQLVDYLSHIDLKRDGINFVVGVNGTIVEDLNYNITDGDIIAVSANIEAAAAATFVAGQFGAATWALWLTTYVAVAFSMTYGASALASALGPDVASPENTSSNNQLYSWGPVTQTIGEGGNIPLLFGTNRVSGQVINNYVSIKNNKETLNTLIGICDHAVDSISSIYINNQANTYYNDVEVITRLGTTSDTVIPGFEDIIHQTDRGTKLDYNEEVEQATNSDVIEKLVVIVTAPNGIYYTRSNGRLEERTAEFTVSYRAVGAGSWIEHSEVILTKATTSPVKKLITIDDLAQDHYEIQLVRTNAAESSHRGNSDIYFSALQEITKEPLIYPGLAKYAIKVLATDQLSGSIPTYSAVAARDFVSVWDEDANGGEGAWGTRRATSPAWICYALLNTYASIPADKMIWTDFKNWAEYCDDVIDDEYRFEINTVISQGNFWDEIQRVARMGRGSILRRGTRYGVFVDKYEGATPLVSHLFSMGNIIDNSFNLHYLPKKDRANAVDVEYTDIEREYTRQVVTVYSEDYLIGDEINQRATVSLSAAVVRDLAIREGVFRINSNKHINRVITFDAFADSFAATVGDLFYFQHEVPNYGDGFSGRILEAGNLYGGDQVRYVVIDRVFTPVYGVDYSILIRLDNGDIVEREITSFQEPTAEEVALWGDCTILIVSVYFPTIPSKYSPYTAGVTTSYKKLYRITSITRQDNLVRTLTGCEYIEEVYSDNDSLVIEPETWTPITPVAIQVTAYEYLSYESSGSLKSNLSISWVRRYSQDANSWVVWLEDSTSGTDPINIGIAHENAFQYSGDLILDHTYNVYVTPYNEGVTYTSENRGTVTIVGKLAPPADVTNFAGEWDVIKRSVHFTWNAIADVDLSYYEIRSGDSWALGTVVATAKGNNFTSIQIDEGVDATLDYYIKAFDTSGQESLTADYTFVVIDTSETPLGLPVITVNDISSRSVITSDGTDVVSMTARWTGGTSSPDFNYYEIRLTNISDNVTSQHTSSTLEYTWPSVIPNHTYGIEVRRVDISGNTTAWTTPVEHLTAKDTIAPAAPDELAITPTYTANIIMWEHGDEKDLSHFVIERSLTADYGETNVIGAGVTDFSGQFGAYSDSPETNGLYYYWVSAVDSSGNQSAPAGPVSSAVGGVVSGIPDEGILEGHLAANSVTANKILAGSVIAGKIGADAVTATEIDVLSLSAIEANCGILTAGIIQSGELDPTTVLDLDNGTLALGDKFNWDGTNLSLTGTVTIASGSTGIGNLEGVGDLATTDRIELLYTDGADVTAANTAANTSSVGDVAATTITSWQKTGTTKIDGGQITADSISVISGNCGTLTAGIIQSGTGPEDTVFNVTAGTLKLGTKFEYDEYGDLTLGDIDTATLGEWEYLDTTKINGGAIQTNTIDANAINVDRLSAIDANCGLLTAGIIQSGELDPTTVLDLDNGTLALGDKFNWDGTNLSLTGTVTIASGSTGIGNLEGVGDLATTDRIELLYTDGADVTAANTAANTSSVGDVAATTITSWQKTGTTKIDGGKITADELSVITANCGLLTAGKLQNSEVDPTTVLDLDNGTLSLGAKFNWDGTTLSLDGGSIEAASIIAGTLVANSITRAGGEIADETVTFNNVMSTAGLNAKRIGVVTVGSFIHPNINSSTTIIPHNLDRFPIVRLFTILNFRSGVPLEEQTYEEDGYSLVGTYTYQNIRFKSLQSYNPAPSVYYVIV